MISKLILGIWLLAVAGGTGWLLWRSSQLREVRQVNAAQRDRLAAEGREPSRAATAAERLDRQVAGKPPVASPGASRGEGTSRPHAALTPEERNELLRLRGLVGQLRREIAAATRRQSPRTRSEDAIAPIHPAPTEYLPSQDYGPGLPAAASEVIHQIYHQAEQQGGRVPATLPPERLAQLGAEAAELLGQLELLPGETITPESDCCIFIAREREARQTADGRWVRLYLRAAGGFTVAGPVADPDWDRWERQQLGMLRESLRRRMQPPAGTTTPDP